MINVPNLGSRSGVLVEAVFVDVREEGVNRWLDVGNCTCRSAGGCWCVTHEYHRTHEYHHRRVGRLF